MYSNEEDMHTLSTIKADARAAELQRRADLDRPGRGAATRPQMQAEAELSVRMAQEADHEAIVRLAQLDSAATPAGRMLIGSVGSRPAAALSLDDGAVVADPFTPTVELVQLMRMRARQLEALGGPVRRTVRAPLGLLRRSRVGRS